MLNCINKIERTNKNLKKILVHHKRNETSVAIVKNSMLTNYYVDRDDNQHLIGNIYKGKVQNFLPGIQAVFIDIGRDKNAFLQLSKNQKYEIGQDIVIQIKKEAIGTKGPRATTALSIPSHNIVLLPRSKYLGISQKIDNRKRGRLFEIAKKIRLKNAGLIIRTAAQDCDEETLTTEIQNVYKFWKSIERSMIKKKSPSLLYSDNDLMSQIVRDEFTNDVDEFLIDSTKITRQVNKLVNGISPELIERVKRYEDDVPIFEKFHIDKEIAKVNEREVELPSGGFIVIDRTEALTAIDVLNLSVTVFKVNIEAAEAIMRQLRLRDIGGIIIVDFIDMPNVNRKEELMNFLRNEALKDRIKTKIVDMTPLGLVEITRKRSKE